MGLCWRKQISQGMSLGTYTVFLPWSCLPSYTCPAQTHQSMFRGLNPLKTLAKITLSLHVVLVTVTQSGHGEYYLKHLHRWSIHDVIMLTSSPSHRQLWWDCHAMLSFTLLASGMRVCVWAWWWQWVSFLIALHFIDSKSLSTSWLVSLASIGWRVPTLPPKSWNCTQDYTCSVLRGIWASKDSHMEAASTLSAQTSPQSSLVLWGASTVTINLPLDF